MQSIPIMMESRLRAQTLGIKLAEAAQSVLVNHFHYCFNHRWNILLNDEVGKNYENITIAHVEQYKQDYDYLLTEFLQWAFRFHYHSTNQNKLFSYLKLLLRFDVFQHRAMFDYNDVVFRMLYEKHDEGIHCQKIIERSFINEILLPLDQLMVIELNELGFLFEETTPLSRKYIYNPILKEAENGDWGFLKENGEWRSLSSYDIAGDFIEGIAKVGKNGQWGLINSDGIEFFPLQEEINLIGTFSEGLAKISSVKNRKYGFIDYSGEIVIPMEYDIVGDFQEGLAYVYKKGGKFGYLNRIGKIILPFEYELANTFCNGLAVVSKQKGHDKFININKKGKVISEYVSEKFSENKKRFEEGDPPKYGFVNISQEKVIEPYWDFAGNFSFGLCLVRKGNKYGFINHDGKLTIPLMYDEAEDFSDGFAKVAIDEKWGFINTDGNIVIPLIYESVTNFKNGLARVKLNDRDGFINHFGEFIIPLDYSSNFSLASNPHFLDGLAEVYIPLENGKVKIAYINKLNKCMVNYNKSISTYMYAREDTM